MGTEIERKFLVNGPAWKKGAFGLRCCQGYLCVDYETTVRVRIKGDKGYLTVKGRSTGITRKEYEYEIPVTEAREMLDNICEKPLIEKQRYTITYKGFVWEVDEFAGENKGLVVAEIEIESEDQVFERPEWVGKEVSEDPRYYNVSLVRNPWTSWNNHAG